MKAAACIALAALLSIGALSGCLGGQRSDGGFDSQNVDESYKNFTRKGPVGLETIENFDQLPYIKYGVTAKQVSSHDRNGTNDDGFVGTYSYLRVIPSPTAPEAPEFVIFDEKGPGCVYRVWMTDSVATSFKTYSEYAPDFVLNGNIKFYFDGETTPRIDMSITDFYSGTVAPFLSPLAGNYLASSGGYYCYLPMAFERSLKITTTGPSTFYQVTYHMYDNADGVKTFDPNAVDTAKAIEIFNNAGSDPKAPIGDTLLNGNKTAAAGQEAELMNISGGGRINSIKLNVAPNDDAALANVWLKMHWDGENEPSVYAPIGEFFGSGLGEYEMKSLPIGMIPGQYYYCYFPMPFDGGARIIIENRGAANATIEYEIAYNETRYYGLGSTSGYFHATHHAENPTTPGRDYLMFEANGTGHFVGETYTMSSINTTARTYLEGDERIYFDGSRSPAIYGTGTEDYYTSGWYFLFGTYSLPTHGNPAHEVDTTDRTVAYRMHFTDFLPFHSGMRFGIEHGAIDDTQGNHSSVSYWYGIDEPTLVLTDDLDVGSDASEKAHGYTTEGTISRVENTFQFEGDDDDIDVTEGGVVLAQGATLGLEQQDVIVEGAVSKFTLEIDPDNVGVKLRRLLDIATDDQQAVVYVDGKELPVPWYTAAQRTHNWAMSLILGPLPIPGKESVPGKPTTMRWLESDYEIPMEYTEGKSSIAVEIHSIGSILWNAWNEYHYWAYSYIAG